MPPLAAKKNTQGRIGRLDLCLFQVRRMSWCNFFDFLAFLHQFSIFCRENASSNHFCIFDRDQNNPARTRPFSFSKLCYRYVHTVRCPQVPVLESFPSPLVPATVEDRGGRTASSASGGTVSSPSGDDKAGVVSPSRVRLREDMWVSSRTFYVLDAEVCIYEALFFTTVVTSTLLCSHIYVLAHAFESLGGARDVWKVVVRTESLWFGYFEVHVHHQSARSCYVWFYSSITNSAGFGFVLPKNKNKSTNLAMIPMYLSTKVSTFKEHPTTFFSDAAQ